MDPRVIGKDELARNVAAVHGRIASACRRARRAPSSVSLVAVTKLHPVGLVRLAYELGLRDFGENYAQELRDKAQGLLDCAQLRWHAIGPVQPKNAKYVARAAHVFHALERLEVAEELSRRRTGAPLQCLVEVNVGAQSSKAGVGPAELPALLAQVRPLANIQVIGLTAMPPLVDDAADNRPHFEALAQLARQHGLRELSMGTTGDFEVAIEEGATMIRLGTALFGARPVTAP